MKINWFSFKDLFNCLFSVHVFLICRPCLSNNTRFPHHQTIQTYCMCFLLLCKVDDTKASQAAHHPDTEVCMRCVPLLQTCGLGCGQLLYQLFISANLPRNSNMTACKLYHIQVYYICCFSASVIHPRVWSSKGFDDSFSPKQDVAGSWWSIHQRLILFSFGDWKMLTIGTLIMQYYAWRGRTNIITGHQCRT